MSQDHREFDNIWPRISAEIGRARRREALRRRFPGWAMAASAAALATGLAAVGLARSTRPSAAGTCRCAPWNLAHIVPVENVSPEYPLVCGKTVFAIRGEGRDRRIVCVRKRSGAVEWESAIRFSECRFASDERRLYLLYRETTPAWQCVALDVRSGAELWRRPTEDPGAAPPSMLTVVGDAVAWSRGNRLVLCSGADGRTAWSQAADAGDVLSAARTQGGAVFAASRRTAYAFRAADGDLLWRHTISERPGGERRPGLLELDGERVYVAGRTSAGGGRIACLEAGTGEEVWVSPSDVPFRLQVADGQVYVRSLALSVLDARSGAPRWQAPLGGCGPISFGKGRLYLVDAADRRELVALDSQSGQTAWRRGAVGSCSGIVADRSMGFISGNDGVLHAVAL